MYAERAPSKKLGSCRAFLCARPIEVQLYADPSGKGTDDHSDGLVKHESFYGKQLGPPRKCQSTITNWQCECHNARPIMRRCAVRPGACQGVDKSDEHVVSQPAC